MSPSEPLSYIEVTLKGWKAVLTDLTDWFIEMQLNVHQ